MGIGILLGVIVLILLVNTMLLSSIFLQKRHSDANFLKAFNLVLERMSNALSEAKKSIDDILTPPPPKPPHNEGNEGKRA